MAESYYDDDEVTKLTKSTIRVIAPATLDAGYSFDVMVDGNPYSVRVPSGGVKEGQEFDVPYEPQGGEEEESCGEEEDDDGMTQPVQTMSEEEEDEEDGPAHDEMTGAPMGRWRTSLCSCCDVLTQSTFWMAFCCTPVMIAQLVTRLGLTWNGREGTKEETSLSFNRIVMGMMGALAIWKIPVLGFFVLIVYFFLIVVIVGSRVRAHVRRKYKVPASLPRYCGGNGCDDGCCMLFCCCCSAIQMARHTHDDKEYPGHGCTTTGLGYDAPVIV